MNALTLARSVSFATPWALTLLAVLPAWWMWRRRRRRSAIVFSQVAVLASGPRAGRGIARSIFVMRNLALIGLIVALARPRSAGRAEQNTSAGINIVSGRATWHVARPDDPAGGVRARSDRVDW